MSKITIAMVRKAKPTTMMFLDSKSKAGRVKGGFWPAVKFGRGKPVLLSNPDGTTKTFPSETKALAYATRELAKRLKAMEAEA